MQGINHKGRYKLFFAAVFIGRLKRRIKKSKHRRYVLTQWVTTQQSFKMDLTLAIQYIKAPFLKQKIIDNSQSMKSLSELMIQAVGIIRKQKNPNRIHIGQNLIKFGSFYKLYGSYFGNRLKSEQLLKQIWQSNKQKIKQIEIKFRQAAKNMDQRKQNMTISDCLQQPQYRMFKYVLLLKDYLKKMPATLSDYPHVKKALNLFEQINMSNNQLMGKLQAASKKAKLDKFNGKTIDNSSIYIVQMTAETLYFPVKLYIFSNLVIVSAVQNIFGFQQQRKFTTIYLNQFSSICSKPNTKYFKNVIQLFGMYESLHFYTQDPGSKHQIITVFQKVIRQLQVKAKVRREQKVGLSQKTGAKLTFLVQMRAPQIIFYPQFRIKVVAIQVRPLSTFSNDTVYWVRFSGPLALQDFQTLGIANTKTNQSQGIGQLVQVHLSNVVQILKNLREEYPSVSFPQIDPLTKQMNVFTQGKKNTKMYEVRGYLFEQFFNFVFRNPTVMMNPHQIIHKHKIISHFWQYLYKKNNYLTARNIDKKNDSPQKGDVENNKIQNQYQNNYPYGKNHCDICKLVISANTLQDLLSIRCQYFVNKINHYCFNAMWLLELKTKNMDVTAFVHPQQMLYKNICDNGRVDYLMLYRQPLYKKYQEVKVYIGAQKIQWLVEIDYRKKVGEIMLDLGKQHLGDSAMDYRLIIRYQGKQRILDQDEVLFDLIARYKFQAQQRQNADRQSRQSFNLTSMNKQQGFFSFFTSTFSTKVDCYLTFRKVIFLTKELEIYAFERNIKRAKFVIQQLYNRLIFGEISLSTDDWAQVSGLWAVMNLWGKNDFKYEPQYLPIISDHTIPRVKRGIIDEPIFIKTLRDVLQQYKKKLKGSISDKQMIKIYVRCLRVFYRSVLTYSYFLTVNVHTVPQKIITDGRGPMSGECFIAVTYRQFLVFRQKGNIQPAVRISLQDIRITRTTFSLFIQTNYLSSTTSSTLDQGNFLRFDGRLLFHFQQLIENYRQLKKVFPHKLA